MIPKEKVNWISLKETPIPKGTDYAKIMFNDWYGIVKVMADIDGYLMCRRPSCSPFIVSKKLAIGGKYEYWKFKTVTP